MALSVTRSSADNQPPGGWPTPRSAYVHIPFCRHRCGYCNFSVIADREDLADRFLRALDSELVMLDRPRLRTLFLGGGTPTHLSAEGLRQLLELIRNRFEFENHTEWSVEANPEDITAEKLALLVDHGVNRISLGVQSFQDAKLRTLERGHTAAAAIATIETVANMIANVSIDLIFAAPDETLEDWKQDLQTALSLPIKHLSTYALTFEKGTAFWTRRHHGNLKPLDESIEVDMYQAAREMTADAGLVQYEISNFSKHGYRCRHNLGYWNGQGWYAAGPGAARFVAGRREVNHRSTTTYLKRLESGDNPTAESEAISVVQYARERAAFGLRLIEGIDLDVLSRETGVELTTIFADAIDESVAEGLLAIVGQRLRMTERGVLFADTLATRFLG